MTTWRNLTRMPCLFRLFLGFGGLRAVLFVDGAVLSETVEPLSPSKGPSSTVNSPNRMGLTAEGRLRTEINPWSPLEGSHPATLGSRFETGVSQGV